MPFGGLSRQEILRGAANRLLYSKFYTYYYIGMSALGLVSLITAFIEACPSLFFIVIESTLCLCMILEIITRAVATQWGFLTSWWNYFDIVIVLFCGVTLILLSGGCSAGSNSEELVNTILLVVRNAAQCFRLFATVRKNRRQMDARDLNVDIDGRSGFLDIIHDIDGLAIDTDPEYHNISAGATIGVGSGGGGGESYDFRLSIDSFSDNDNDGVSPPPSDPQAQTHRSNSRSSATSTRSATERITGRKKNNGVNQSN
ncbi:hypothetical protein GGI11_000131 [Coemansia sp. RSA 2049]|nr:hypothetical protein GGI11_000131 [Coemansia sp. RSA 2049]KAJ2611641.1 hypothetical protein EV177_003389 [Coemansia sp. RSA 1804]